MRTGAPSRGLTAEQALAKARASGHAVVAGAATTASGTLTANPDGSLTLKQSLVPVRRLVNGRWVGLDATLRRSADGSVSPAVTTSGLRLSGGGSGPLATMRQGARSLSVWLPMRLPAPALSGDTATYRGVLPGVDVRVAADAQGGFSEVLVVHSAAAAANPALSRLVLATRATGVTVSAGAGGEIVAKDPAGNTVFATLPARMWDSARPPAQAKLVTNPQTGQRIAAHGGMPAFSSAASPGGWARVAPVGVGVRAGSVSLVPDRAMLASRSTVFPVYVDPTFTAPSWGSADSAWAEVQNYYTSQTYWKPSGWLQVGYNGWSSPFFVARSFYRMPVPSVIKGSTVLSAQINFTEEWSPSCSGREVDLWHTGGISSSTDWSNQPGWDSKLGSKTVAHGYDSSCPPAGVGFDITSFIQGVANDSTFPSSETFGLRAADESDAYGWKQFKNSATMAITYDHTADKPTGLTTSPSTSCTAPTPTTIGDGDVTLYIPVNDPDNGSTGSPQVGLKLRLWDTATGTYVSGFPVYPGSLYQPWGTTIPYLVPKASLEALANGKVTKFSWAAAATDFRIDSSGNYVYSSYSSTCNFYFDPTRPGAADINPTPTCSSLPPPSCPEMGSPATFAISPSSGTVPSKYLYQLNGGPPGTVSADSSGNAQITVTPTRFTNALTVTSQSVGGNIGDTASLDFTAGPGLTAADADMNGDGTADLVTVGGANGLPAGVWLAAGTGAGMVATVPANLGAQGNGTVGDDSPADFNGSQVITGHFYTGSGLQDVLAYYPATGTGNILHGSGDGSVIQAPLSGNEQPLSQITDLNGDFPQQLVNAGNTSKLGEPLPDLLSVSGDSTVGYSLTLYSSGQLGVYVDDASPNVMGYDISATLSPDGTLDWNSWQLATTQLPSGTAMYVWNSATGALYLWENLAYNAAGADLSYTQYVIADGSASTWHKGAALTLKAADMNNDGTPDLWTVGAGKLATAYLATLGTGTAALAVQTAQTLLPPAHAWLLNDQDSGLISTAADSAGTLTGTGSGNASWNTGDPLFSRDGIFDGTNSAVATSSPALTPSKDFTVSLWAKPQGPGAVVSQDMKEVASFRISARPDVGYWRACMVNSDSTSPTEDCVNAGVATVDVWSHVTFTYKASTGTMSLYVEGSAASTASHSPLTGVTNGAFQMGDYLSSATHGYFFPGETANVQVWNSVVPPQ